MAKRTFYVIPNSRGFGGARDLLSLITLSKSGLTEVGFLFHHQTTANPSFRPEGRRLLPSRGGEISL
jgi:hypothetical protein